MTAYKTVNPATGETLKEFPLATAAEVEHALADSKAAFRGWQSAPVEARAKVIARVAELYRERRDELARLIATEMGKPLAQSRGEVGLVADIYAYYADEGPSFLRTKSLRSRAAARPSSAPRRSGRCWGSCRGTTPTTRWRGSPPPT